MLGTVGERDRMEGTVISDSVNLTSRLEGLASVFGARIVVSEDFLRRLPDPVAPGSRFLGRGKVKWRAAVIGVHEILGPEDEPKRQGSARRRAPRKGVSGRARYSRIRFTLPIAPLSNLTLIPWG